MLMQDTSLAKDMGTGEEAAAPSQPHRSSWDPECPKDGTKMLPLLPRVLRMEQHHEGRTKITSDRDTAVGIARDQERKNV